MTLYFLSHYAIYKSKQEDMKGRPFYMESSKYTNFRGLTFLHLFFRR